MRRHVVWAWLLLLATTTLGIVVISCGGSSKCVGEIPVPTLKSAQPTTVSSQDPSTTISLSGSGFISSSRVFLNSVLLASTVVDSHHITAIVTPQVVLLISTSNGVEIWVTNPGQLGGGFFGCADGGSSQAVSITIT
ncbi:MAG TPA: hypothetical protein VMT53_08890 [Terriglobales bacterium]|nr:hypothetical protein [Terriglobales bacterium]